MSKALEKKILPVSTKRQITIPVKFFKSLELESEIECIFTGEEIILKPLKKESGYFAQEILNDLIDSGYEKDDLKREFAKRSKEIRPAVKRMVKNASEYAKKFMETYKDETEDIFEMEEK
jgi:bifunctional DNA-binding transcriptional regulator/antitoxin component of YhaV-PrlF toxin-antitoxin module